jgi:hypothetical protein
MLDGRLTEDQDPANIIILDEMGDEKDEWKHEIRVLTGATAYPILFIKGKYLGDFESLERLSGDELWLDELLYLGGVIKCNQTLFDHFED